MALPFVQTKLGQYATNAINDKYKTNISVEQVAVTVFGGVKLKKVLILDHHQDTLIYANRIKTSILDFKKIIETDLIFGDIHANGLFFNMKTYKKERQSNLDHFVNAFNTGAPPSKKHFLMTASRVMITQGHYRLIDENKQNPIAVDFTNINLASTALRIYGPDVSTTVNALSFQDHRGIVIEDLKGKFSYTPNQIRLDDFYVHTKESSLKGSLVMNYVLADFANFTDKVEFDMMLEKSNISTIDIRKFYAELGKDERFKIRGRIKGPLNNLVLSNLNLYNTRNSQIRGTMNFKNLFPRKGKEFYMNGNFTKLSTSYVDLVEFLPNILGKKLPTIIQKLGTISLAGTAEVTAIALNANVKIKSLLGKIKTNVVINNFNTIDKATYSGNILLDDFDIGTLIARKDLGRTSLDLAVEGRGFSEKYLQTGINGVVSALSYKNYTYKNIDLNGIFNKGLYKGIVAVDDPNLHLNYDGLIDLSKKENSFDFHVNVQDADFKKLNLTKDLISKFTGDVIVKLTGNSIDNLQGDVFINKIRYENPKANYVFNDFYINSSFDQLRVRTIEVKSSDIVKGKVVGKFQFNQLQNLVENALGSLYENYRPIKVNKGQFLSFDFTIYSKIIEIFYPDISIATNTTLKGKLGSENEEFKLNFNSPKIIALSNTFDNIRVNLDNKNPLYSAFIEVDSIKTKQYNIRDFSLINVIVNDTMHIRSEFKGGSKGSDYFNLNLYHTFNKENMNVVGLQKSELKLKDYLWYLNENEESNNQIIFDNSLRNFTFDDIILTHNEQEISFVGNIRGSTEKDLKLRFKNVDLNQITPVDPKFVFNGNINGKVDIKQQNGIYQLPASVQIDNLNINKTAVGNLNFDITADESLKKFLVNADIQNDNSESFVVNGSFEIADKNAILDLQLKLDQFNLGFLSPLGGSVISNIRGFASGNASIEGKLNQLDINGRLYVDEAGLKVPYLNTDYTLDKRSVIDLTNEKFIIKNNVITDTKFGTKGYLNGVIEHHNFADWKLDLKVNSKNLLVLDTKDSEDAAYFGIAFINGVATIKGPTNSLFIKVDARSEKGSSLKIPINDSESVSSNDFLHFLTPKEKFNIKNGIVDNSRNYKGLELEFDLDITPDAEVEVILDRNTGHGMKGRGNGTLLLKINTLGTFNMYGDFQAYEGNYNFKYGGLIDKKFIVKKGGYISWEGNPMKARLNLEAIYKTSANPSVLLDNSSFNQKVDVNVIIGLRGDMTNPEPDFNFEFPRVSNVLKSEIEYKLNDKVVRETQALYLLSTGTFLSAEGLSQTALSQSAFETASSLLSGLIKSTDEKFQVSLDIIGADRTTGQETDGRFVADISSKINERVTINGKIGVPFGGVTQSAVVGNVEILYRVNEDGTVNLRFFNRENDISFVGQGIGYTQGGGLSYEVDFDTFKELANKFFRKKLFKKIKNSDIIDNDSNFILDKEESKSKKPNPTETNPPGEDMIPEQD